MFKITIEYDEDVGYGLGYVDEFAFNHSRNPIDFSIVNDDSSCFSAIISACFSICGKDSIYLAVRFMGVVSKLLLLSIFNLIIIICI